MAGRNVYTISTSALDGTGSESPGALCRVLFANGRFDNNVSLEDSTLQYLAGLVTDKRRGDVWTLPSLRNYLAYTWVRLLEENKVLVCQAPRNTLVREAATVEGVSEYFLLWNSGLVNKQNQSILFLCVQRTINTTPAYILLRSGIFCGEYPSFLMQDVVTNGLIIIGNRVGSIPLTARFVAPRHPALLFDDEANFDINVGHLMENAARFIDARVVDEAEFIVGNHGDPIDTGLYPNAVWVADERFRLADNRYIAVNNFGGVSPYFRRRQQGMNSFTHLLERWVREAVEFCRRTRSLVVAQFYYHRAMGVLNQYFYRGDLQLLLPLYCEEDSVRLALTMEYVANPAVPGTFWYAARTVLTKDWARSNARLLSCPQVNWMSPSV